jgi:hypothetical protein
MGYISEYQYLQQVIVWHGICVSPNYFYNVKPKSFTPAKMEDKQRYHGEDQSLGK